MSNTVTMTMTREEAVRVLAMLAQDAAPYVNSTPVVTEQQVTVTPAPPVAEEPKDRQSDTPTLEEAQDYQAPTDTPIPPPADDLVDIDGTPWDERIHSGGKSKMANGQWTKRRGVTPALYDMVMSELTVAAATPFVPPPAPPAPVTPPAPPATVEEPPFVALQKKVQAWIASAVDVPQRSERAQALGKALKDYGVVSLPALANQPELIPAIEMALAL